MAKKLDLTCNVPESKSDLTRDNMLDYMLKKEGITAEEKKWFHDLLNNNKKNKKNNMTGKIEEGYDLPTIREAFAQKYFPEISTKEKKAKKSANKALKFEDKLAQLLQ